MNREHALEMRVAGRGHAESSSLHLSVCRRAMAWVGTEEEVAQLNEMADGEVVAAQKEVKQLNGSTKALENGNAIMNAFKLFDADGDGKLTEDEVIGVLTRKTGMMTELSEEAARATWQRWLAEFDVSKDGKISYRELSDAVNLDRTRSVRLAEFATGPGL